MTHPDGTGSTVRELYRTLEPLVEGAAGRLVPAVRARERRRRAGRRVGYAASAVAVAAVLAGVATLVAVSGGAPVAKPRPVGTATPDPWRLESSLGIQMSVPAAWVLNDFGCHQDDRPTVVRGQVTVLLCYTPTPPRKEFVVFEGDAVSPATGIGDGAARLPARHVTIDGVPAVRAEGAITGGRYAGWIIVPSRNAEVYARTNSEATLTRMLDSARVVAVDFNGCPTRSPGKLPPRSDLATFVDPHPASISVCDYARMLPLQASARHTGADAESLAAALNATRPGHVRTLGDCAPEVPAGYDAVLVVTSADGTARQVVIDGGSCGLRWMDNGDGQHKLYVPLMTRIMDGTGGFGYSPDAPGQ